MIAGGVPANHQSDGNDMVPLLLLLILLVIAWPVFAIFGGTLFLVIAANLHIIVPAVVICIAYVAFLVPLAKRNNIKLGGKMGEALDPSKPIGPEFQKLMQESTEAPASKASFFNAPDQWRPVPQGHDQTLRRALASDRTKPQNRKRAFALAALTFIIAGPLTVIVLDWGMNRASADGALLGGLSSPAVASQSAPTVQEGRWRVEASTDPIDDTKTIKISLAADSTGGETVRPALVARCQSGKTDVYVAWDTYVGTEPDFPDSPYRDVAIRIGELPSDRATTILSSDKTATFFGSIEVFLQNLYHREKLAVRITPYMSAPLTALFDLTGFERAMEPLREACGWAGATFIEGRVSVSTDPVRYGMIDHIGTGRDTTPFSPAIPGAGQLIQKCAQPGNERVCYIKGRVVDRQLVEVYSVRAE